MISVVENGEVYEVSFRYDPVLVAKIKNVPGKRWNPQAKMWTIPKEHLGWWMNELKDTPYESQVQLTSSEAIGENATVDTTVEIPDVDISGIKLFVENGKELYKHQTDFMKYALHRDTIGRTSGFILADEPGAGKAFTLDTKIYTPTGYKLIRDIEVGDRVFNEKGEPVTVTATYDHEALNMYKVTFSDGKHVTCCEDHLWTVLNNEFKPTTCSLSQILDGSWRYQKKRRGYNYQTVFIPRCQPVQFEAQPVPLDPYLIGALLGDGCLAQDGAVGFTTSDSEMVDKVSAVLPEGYHMHSTPSSCDIDYTIVRKVRSRNPQKDQNHVVKALKQLQLFGTRSHTKFIPDVYKYNSVDVRLAVVQGLMDTDGYASTTNELVYTTVSEQLKDDVTFMIESLGGVTHERFNSKTQSWDVCVQSDDPRIFCRLTRKKQRLRKRRFTPRRRFANIEYVGKLPGRCITVSGESKLYLCDHFIVTHNTLECMNLAMYRKTKYKYKHCLIIVCVNPAKYNWVEDIVKHTNGVEEPYILGTRLKRDKVTKNCSTGTKEKLADLVTGHMYGDKSAPKLPYFIVMNIEGLRATTGKGKARKFPITDEIIKWIHTGKLNMIAIDEIHKNTSPTSTQGKQLLRIKKETDRKVYWMPITGTPITNTPTDVFTPLKLVDGHAMSSYYAWCQRFCVYGGYGGYEIVSYKNIPQLKSMLQGNMIRRLKGDFIDLPPKIFYTDYVENTSYQEKLYDAVAAELQNEKGTILSSPNPAARFLRLRQVNGSPELIDSECHVTDKDYLSKNAKLTRCLELIDECTARGEKVIVFSNWVEPLRTLYKFVSQHYKVCCFTGTMKEAERQKHKEVFMTNPEYKVLIGTVGAMGVSHTLTAANNVIFYDEPWTPTDRDQALDRVHRPGATKTIHIHVLLSKDTVDDRVHEVLYTKEAISKYVVDNQLDFKHHPELFDMLIH